MQLNLNTLLTGQAPNGSWSLTSFPVGYVGPSGVLCTTCANPFYFDYTCITPGNYVFTYSVTSSCGTSSQSVTLTVNESGSIDPIGAQTQCILCGSPQATTISVTVKNCNGVNLNTPINWSLVSMPGTIFVNGGTAVTNPFNVTFVPTTTTYRLFLDDCATFEDFTIVPQNSVDQSGNVMWNSFVSTPTVDSQFLTGTANITKALCSTNTVSNSTLGDWTYQTSLSFSMGTGTSVTSVELYNQANIPTVFTLSSFLTGCAGTVLIGDLTFNGSNSSIVSAAIQTCLRNATGCNSDLSCNFSAEGTFLLATGAKHQPTLWWGLKKNTSVLTLSTAATFTASPGFGVKTAGTRTYNWTENVQNAPCPIIDSNATRTYPNNGSLAALLNTALCDFNFLSVVATPNFVFTSTTNTNPTVSCC